MTKREVTNYNIRVMKEKREAERKKVSITTVVRKTAPDGRYSIMEFRTLDISLGGIFISTENLSIFDLGEEIEILVDDKGKKYYDGKARVVRSARILSQSGSQVESGFGLMFLNPEKEFINMIKSKLET